MEEKLRKCIGQSDVWLFVKSSNSWLRNVQILDVNSETVNLRYEQQSETDNKTWEKTTRIDNIAEIDICVSAMPNSLF
jgi:hypothetical protein